MKISDFAFVPVLALFLGLVCACSGAEADGVDGGADADKSVDEARVPEHFWAVEMLPEPQDVKDIRDAQELPEEVTVRGTLQDFGKLATFKLVEDSLEDCSETEDDQCPTPWDYCCEDPDALSRYTINVELMDEGDMPGRWELEGFHGLKRLSEVIVKGKLVEDEAGNLRIEAEKIAMQ